jgi:hypothetical protein
MILPLHWPVIELLWFHRIKPVRHFPKGTLKRLRRLGLVEGMKVLARPALDLIAPLAVVKPGDPMPDCDALAYAGEKRLEPPIEFEVFRATQRAANIFGGIIGQVQPLQAGHDVQVSSVLEAHRKRGLADCWFSEDVLRQRAKGFKKYPDALVFTPPQYTAVEIIGDYSASRIREFVEVFNGYGLIVELW